MNFTDRISRAKAPPHWNCAQPNDRARANAKIIYTLIHHRTDYA